MTENWKIQTDNIKEIFLLTILTVTSSITNWTVTGVTIHTIYACGIVFTFVINTVIYVCK